jgi:vacuolar-type H+-ATPase subunit E/Vma4
MEEKQVISKKIIEDASSTAEAIVTNALKEADEQRLSASKKADEDVALVEAQAKAEGELLIERKKTLARLDAKKIALDCKQELLARAFEDAKQRLLSLNAADYLEFIKKQIERHAEKGDTVSICLTAPISVEQVSALETVNSLGLKVIKSDNFGGGIKLLGQKTDKDLSFNAILAQFAATNTQSVSAIIFK